jgi:hypothetical protein
MNGEILEIYWSNTENFSLVGVGDEKLHKLVLRGKI